MRFCHRKTPVLPLVAYPGRESDKGHRDHTHPDHHITGRCAQNHEILPVAATAPSFETCGDANLAPISSTPPESTMATSVTENPRRRLLRSEIAPIIVGEIASPSR